jgi:hypothetical protein
MHACRRAQGAAHNARAHSCVCACSCTSARWYRLMHARINTLPARARALRAPTRSQAHVRRSTCVHTACRATHKARRCSFRTVLASHVWRPVASTLHSRHGRVHNSASQQCIPHGVDLCSYIVAGAVAVLAASYASVPLYRLYCQSTGKMRLLPLFYPSQPRQGTRRAYSHILLGAVRVPTMPSASLLRGCLLGLSSSGTQCDLCCLACRTVPLRRRFGRPRDCDDA